MRAVAIAVLLLASGPAHLPRDPETPPAVAKEASDTARVAPAIELAFPTDLRPLKWTWM